MGLSKQIVYLRDFAEEAAKLRNTWGRTELFLASTRSRGIPNLNDYFGGGYGREGGYEIVILYGDTGVGKSTVGLNFLQHPIESGKKVGLLVLEDSGADVYIRLSKVLGPAGTKQFILEGNNIHFMPQEDLVKSWKLDDLLVLIEEWFIERDIDVIFLDHLQFAFEGAESIKGENEYTSQRIFMQKLNQLMKKINKTIILVSHVNKSVGAKGMSKIVGSGSIAQAGTKVIEVEDNSDNMGSGALKLTLRKSRFTPKPDYSYEMRLDKGVLIPI
jgi:predicted ATP-dependent serine protease